METSYQTAKQGIETSFKSKASFLESIAKAQIFDIQRESFNDLDIRSNYNCDCYTCQCDSDRCDCVCQGTCDSGPCYGSTA
mgnify:CR=1 FL=1